MMIVAMAMVMTLMLVCRKWTRDGSCGRWRYPCGGCDTGGDLLLAALPVLPVPHLVPSWEVRGEGSIAFLFFPVFPFLFVMSGIGARGGWA